VSIGDTFSTSFDRVESLDTDMSEATTALQETLPSLAADAHIRRPLSDLREQIEADKLDEYAATGLTPARKQYAYPTTLPRTDGREELLDRLRNGTRSEQDSQAPRMGSKSPSKGLVFADLPSGEPGMLNSRPGTASSTSTTVSLREIDPNTLTNTAPSIDFVAALPGETEKLHLPPMKRFNTTNSSLSKGPLAKKRGVIGVRRTVAGNALLAERLADRENVTMPNLSASVGAGAVHPGTGRRLRSHERNGL
jgi:kinesin family protein 11